MNSRSVLYELMMPSFLFLDKGIFTCFIHNALSKTAFIYSDVTATKKRFSISYVQIASNSSFVAIIEMLWKLCRSIYIGWRVLNHKLKIEPVSHLKKRIHCAYSDHS